MAADAAATMDPEPMDDRLNSRRLHYFMQVLETGSVRGPRTRSAWIRPRVSRAIGLLERECGIQLLERRGRGVRLIELPMKNSLLSQGQVQAVTRHRRLLSPATAKLMETIVADMAGTLSGH